MTQAPVVETMELRIVACTGCDQLFLVSPRRENCPTCGSGDVVEFFTFDAGPDGVQLRGGLAVEAAAPPPPEPASSNGIPSGDLAPVDQVPAADDEPVATFAASVAFFLEGERADLPVEVDELREQLLALGADNDAATIALGRLEAVRNLLADLTRSAEPETESPPPAAEPGDGEESVTTPEAALETT